MNRELILLYWDIGQAILDRQALLGWGKSVVEQLSRDLQSGLPGVQGFSARNLWDMRRFYEAYSQPEVLRQLVAQPATPKRRQAVAKHRLARKQ